MEESKIVAASEFKSHFLGYLKRTGEFKEEFIISRRGQPIAKLVPLLPSDTLREPFKFGRLSGTVTIKGDIMAPIDEEEWTVDEHNI